MWRKKKENPSSVYNDMYHDISNIICYKINIMVMKKKKKISISSSIWPIWKESNMEVFYMRRKENLNNQRAIYNGMASYKNDELYSEKKKRKTYNIMQCNMSEKKEKWHQQKKREYQYMYVSMNMKKNKSQYMYICNKSKLEKEKGKKNPCK